MFRRLPVGTNAEITAALAGDNIRGIAPLTAVQPSIDTRGDLLDRWGTRFFFQQLSHDPRQVRSAGSDLRRFTHDDVVRPDSDPATSARLKDP